MSASCEIKLLANDVLTKSVPKVDKAVLIKAFVDSQKQHARTYAAEGKLAFSNWKDDLEKDRISSDSKSRQDTNPALAGDGLSSPILRPRNAKCPSVIQPSNNHLSTKAFLERKYENKCDTVITQTLQSGSSSAKRKQNPVSGDPLGMRKAKTPAKVKSAEHDQADSAKEREMRLAQRRDRRRSKKEIIAPEMPHENYNSESGGQPKSTKTSKGKKRSKLPAGLTLMHGFSAENIGKHRLTTGPTTNFGVFNKGRASTKTSTGKKPVKAPATFDEVNFLNKLENPLSTQLDAAKCATKRVKSGPSLSSKKRRKVLHHQDSRTTLGSAIASSTISSAASSNPQTSTSDDKIKYQSEIWEIEKEFLAAPDVKDAINSSISGKPGTVVVLDTRDLNWDASPIPELVDNRASIPPATDKPENSPITSVATITPSQSVSQVAARPISHNLRTSSRFFPTQSGQPDDDRVSRSRRRGSGPQPDIASGPVLVGESFQGSPRPTLIRVTEEHNRTREYNVTDETGCSLEDVIRKLETDDFELRDLALLRERCCLSIFSTDSTPERDQVIAGAFDDVLITTNLDVSNSHIFPQILSAPASSDARFTPSEAQDEGSGDLLYLHCNAAQDNYEQNYRSDHDITQYVDSDTCGHDDYDCCVGDADREHLTLLFREAQMYEPVFCRDLPGDLAGEDYDCNEAYKVWQDESDGFEMPLASHASERYLDVESSSTHDEGAQNRSPGSPTMEFVEGRFNTAAYRADVSARRYECDIDCDPTLRKGFSALDTLEETEAAVAQKFKNRFYPVKF